MDFSNDKEEGSGVDRNCGGNSLGSRQSETGSGVVSVKAVYVLAHGC